MAAITSKVHERLLSSLRAHIGQGYLESRGIDIGPDTSFDQLNFNIMDEAWVEYLVMDTYAITDLRFDPWPETIGGMLAEIDHHISALRHRDQRFSDEDLVYVSFAGGACGHAMRHVLLLSPDAAGFDGLDDIDSLERMGSMHGMLPLSGIGLTLNRLAVGIGLSPSAWYDYLRDPCLIVHARRMIDEHGAMARAKHGKHGTWVWADHAPPRQARMVFPNARMVVLRRTPFDMARDFIIKNGMEPVEEESMRDAELGPNTRSMDHHVRKRIGDAKASRSHYRDRMLDQIQHQLRMQEAICEDAARMGLHVVDVDRLLDGIGWRDEYAALMSHLSMAPDYDRVGRFLGYYASRQYDRSTWTPSPDWNWVRLGPNIPGRW